MNKSQRAKWSHHFTSFSAGEYRSRNTNHKANNVGYICKQGAAQRGDDQYRRAGVSRAKRVKGRTTWPCSVRQLAWDNWEFPYPRTDFRADPHTPHTHTTSLPQVTSSGYYSVSSVNDSIFPRLITWSNTRVTKSSVRQQNTGVVIIPLFPPANPIWTAYCVRTGVHPWLDLMETCDNMWARLRWCKVTSPWVALFSHISPLMLFNDPLPLLEDKEVRRKNTHGSHNRLW